MIAPTLADIHAASKYDPWFLEQIADIVRTGQQSGEFPVDDPAEDLALRLGALIDGLAVQVLMNDADVTPERMRDVCLEVAARELGFEPEPAAKR